MPIALLVGLTYYDCTKSGNEPATQEPPVYDPNRVTTHAEALAYHAAQVERDANTDRWNAEYEAQEARKSPEALLTYLKEHFPARWVQCAAPEHRFWDAPCAEWAFGKVLVKVTFSTGSCAVDFYPNVMPQCRSVHPVDFAKELRVTVKVIAAQDPTIVLPEWAI